MAESAYKREYENKFYEREEEKDTESEKDDKPKRKPVVALKRQTVSSNSFFLREVL